MGNRLGAYSAGVVAVGSVENLKLINDKMKLAAKVVSQNN